MFGSSSSSFLSQILQELNLPVASVFLLAVQGQLELDNTVSQQFGTMLGTLASPVLRTSHVPGRSSRTMSEEHHIPIHEEFIYCCGAATQVLKFGPWKDLLKTSGNIQPKLLFLIIPGNPGVVGFYRTFMESLYCDLDQKYPVWAVSHAGHCAPPRGMDMTHDNRIEDIFGLNGQIEHKLAFLQKTVPPDMKLVLIGHSIGCYIILEMMKRAVDLKSSKQVRMDRGTIFCQYKKIHALLHQEEKDRRLPLVENCPFKRPDFRSEGRHHYVWKKVVQSILLFPTIERMAMSPQGKIMTPLLCSLRYVIYMPLYLLSFLPETMKTLLVKFVLRGIKSVDNASVSASLNLFRVDCAANAMYMGSQEMLKVVERDNDTIKKNLSKLIFYYGASDNWCPAQYYEDIRKEFPEGNIWLCEKGIRHAFVLDSSREVASMIVHWLNERSDF